jgi:tetratricopeptide (TPR) repeat protein
VRNSEESLGERYATTLEALREIAEAYYYQGRLDDTLHLWTIGEQLVAGAEVLPADQVRFLLGYASFLVDDYFLTGREEELMQTVVERARQGAQALQDAFSLATALFLCGRMTYNLHLLKGEADYTDTHDYLQRASALQETIGDSYHLADSLFYTGLTYDRQGPSPQSETLFQRALQLAEQQGNRWVASEAHRHLTDYTQGEQRFTHALRSLELRQEMGFTRSLPPAQLLLAEICVDQGDPARALQYCGQAERLAQEMDLRVYVADALLVRCDIAARQGHLAEAHEYLEQASVLARQLNHGRVVAAVTEKREQLAREQHS